MNVGIYYLIARNVKTNEKIRIELTDRKKGQYCTTLSSVDKLTTQFYSKDQLVKRLNDNKYINFIDADIYIEYSHNGLRFEEVLYHDMENITKLPLETESVFDKTDKKFINAANEYIVKLNKRPINNYVYDSPQFNLKFKEHLKKYIDEQYRNTSVFNLNKLYEDLASYKTFRDLYFAINNHIYHKTRQELSELERLRSTAKLVEYNPVKVEPKEEVKEEIKFEQKPEIIKPEIKEEQMKFDLTNNEVSLPNSNRSLKEEHERAVQEHREEREEFLTEDDWNQNYYPYNVKNK